MTESQNSWVPVAISVYHASEHPVCKSVGSIIPYRAVVRIMLQVRMRILR